MDFHWSLNDNILAILNNVVRMVSTRPLISKPSSPIEKPLVTVTKQQITIRVIVTFMYHSFFQFPSIDQVLLFTFFQFYCVVSRDSKFFFFADYY